MQSRKTKTAFDPIEAVITSAEAAAMLMLTPEWLRQLVAMGWIKKLGKDRYRTADVVQGHIAYLKDENRRAAKTASASRVLDARAREIEVRVAREQLEVIEADDVVAFFSETLATLRSGLSGIAAATLDPNVRIEVAKNVDAALGRVESAFTAASKAIAARRPFYLDNEGADA